MKNRNTCVVCTRIESLPYRCNYCGAVLCSEHRLPEKHDCDGVELIAADGKRFRVRHTGRVVGSEDSIRPPEPIEPKYTVGTRPKLDFPTSPEVELTPEARMRRESGRESIEAEDLYQAPIERLVNWLKTKFGS